MSDDISRTTNAWRIVFGVEKTAIKLGTHKQPKFSLILEKWLKHGGTMFLSVIYININSIWNEEKLSEEWKESIILPISKRVRKYFVVIKDAKFNIWT